MINPDQKTYSQPIAFVLVLMLLFSMFVPLPFVYADGVKTEEGVGSILRDVAAKVFQNGVEITGNTLDPNADIRIEYSFTVPVIGDAGIDGGYADASSPATFVSGGEFAIFELPDKLKLKNETTVDANFGAFKVGDVILASTSASITFTNTVDNPDISSVGAIFNATMQVDKSGIGNEGGTITIEILGKTFTVTVPAKQTSITGNKSGTADIENEKVKWKVEVIPTIEGGAAGSGSLAGYEFIDNLTNVGTYGGIFKIGTASDGSDAEEPTPSAVYNTGVLSYTFPNDIGSGTRYIFFETEIEKNKLLLPDEQTISNTVTVATGGAVAATISGITKFKMEWITKSGVEVTNQGSGDYQHTGRIIDWTIKANLSGAKINGAEITDILPQGLKFVSASAVYGTVAGINNITWETSSTVIGATTESAVGGTREKLTFDSSELQDKLSSGKAVKITVRTLVEDDDQSASIAQFVNSATLTGTGFPGAGSGNASVGVGVNPIAKTGNSSNYDASKHTMTWNVTVDTKGQDYGSDGLRVMDLLVYAAGSSFTASDFDTIDPGSAGTALTSISNADIAKLTPQFNQRYLANSFSDSDGLGITVHTLKLGGKAVADVLVVTTSTGGGLDYTKSNSFSYKTEVTNPDIYAANGTFKIKNTATLFNGSTKRADSTREVDVTSDMLKKDMMTVTDAGIYKNSETGDAARLAAVNGSLAALDKGFDYVDKSVIFRIHVNNNGLENATNDLTTDSTVTMGSFTVTDTLPAGWKFEKFADGADFHIYEKGGTPLKAMGSAIDQSVYQNFLTGASPAAPTSTAGGEITFTFTKLTKPYVILVKAVPTDEKLKEYFSKNESYTVRNNVALSNSNYTTDPSSFKDFKITSDLLDKQAVRSGNGVLIWTVEYQPYNLGFKQEEYDSIFIEDTLPVGLDLPLDAQGKLQFQDSTGNNITVTELTLNADGSYSDSNTVSPSGVISYDNAKRSLRFDIPDPAKAYRLTYKTYIGADSGAKLTNEVTLNGRSIINAEDKFTHEVSSADASATFVLGATLTVKKTDTESHGLAGAEFTLYDKDGKAAVKKGISGADGTIKFKPIVPGEYVLKETKSPTGYAIFAKPYKVSVVEEAPLNLVLKVDGNLLTGNLLSVINHQFGTVGDLTIEKRVAGNAASQSEKFDFVVTLTTSGGATLGGTYTYYGSGVPDGTISSGDIISLAHGESVTIIGLPKDTTYSVTEPDSKGYTKSSTGPSGTIEADKTMTASFTNTKSKSGGGGDKTPTEPAITTTPGITTNPAITTPEAVYGSVRIVKVDGADTSRTLAGAVFQLLGANGALLQTSPATGSNGVAVFDHLETGVKYYLKEATAPDGYQPSRQTYSFTLSKGGTNRDVTITFRNTKEGEATVTGIDPNDVPAGWVVIEDEIPAGPGDLDVTPKTGVQETSVLLLLSLTALFGTVVVIKGIQIRRRKLVSFHKDN